MKTVSMLQDAVGADGETLKAGVSYSLNDASANHWLKRGLAIEIEAVAAEDQKPEAVKGPKGSKGK